MSTFQIKPPRDPKTSKAPLYAEALRLFLSEPNLTLVDIAQQVGLRPDTLVATAEHQSWHKRRALVTRDASATRLEVASRVDVKLIEATSEQVDKLTEAWSDLTKRVILISVEPDPDLSEQQKRINSTHLLERKSDLLTKISKGYAAMIETATALGLVKGLAKEPEAGKLDFSKLTQLNIEITAAIGDKKAPILAESEPLDLVDGDVI